jgi:protoporphyrinogen/coproporphyrinogen III oxidase
MKKNIAILGAGISGLSLAWFLKKKYGDQINLKIFEKSSRVGGWIQTKKMEGFLFEQGPRSCRIGGNGIMTLNLIEELQLQNEIIVASSNAKKRYIYKESSLLPFPSGLFGWLHSPFLKNMIKALWNDWQTPKGPGEDESIYDFIARRLSPEIAEDFIDPLTSGIYAGDIRQLSMLSCFPELFNCEKRHGGLLRAFFSKKEKQDFKPSLFIQNLQKHSIFTLKKGMETLTDQLSNKVNAEIFLDAEVISFDLQGNKLKIKLKDESSHMADYVFSTLPAKNLGAIIKPHCLLASEILYSIPSASVAVVNLGYREKVLEKNGFGYLIPSKEKSEALGVVWDSNIFPQQQNPQHSSFTVMLGGMHNQKIENWDHAYILNKALNLILEHMNIKAKPAVFAIKQAYSSIPQYLIGHQKKLNILKTEVLNQLPLLMIHGNYLGVSVNDCIANSKAISDNLNFEGKF